MSTKANVSSESIGNLVSNKLVSFLAKFTLTNWIFYFIFVFILSAINLYSAIHYHNLFKNKEINKKKIKLERILQILFAVFISILIFGLLPSAYTDSKPNNKSILEVILSTKPGFIMKSFAWIIFIWHIIMIFMLSIYQTQMVSLMWLMTNSCVILLFVCMGIYSAYVHLKK